MIDFLLFVALVSGASSNGSQYVSRQEALVMDDRPLVRELLKVYAESEGYMYGYQATMFDGGFGSANRGLEYLREYQRRRIESRFPNFPIRR